MRRGKNVYTFLACLRSELGGGELARVGTTAAARFNREVCISFARFVRVCDECRGWVSCVLRISFF